MPLFVGLAYLTCALVDFVGWWCMSFSILSSTHHLVPQNVCHWWSLRKTFENYVVSGYVAASLLWLLLHVQLSIGLSALFAFTSLGRDNDFN
jgi:hypothetical protein